VGDGRYQRHLHAFAGDALVCALLVDDGFVIVELEGDRFAVLYANLHEEVCIRLAGGHLGLDHGLKWPGDHPIHGQGIDNGADETAVDGHYWLLFVGVVSDVTVDGHGRALSERKAPGLDFQASLKTGSCSRASPEALIQC